MDPKETLRLIRMLIERREWKAAGRALDDLERWINRGGFVPEGEEDVVFTQKRPVSLANQVHWLNMQLWVARKFYVSTFCNFAHYMQSGTPIDHECRIIPPEALIAEIDGDYELAMSLMQGGRA